MWPKSTTVCGLQIKIFNHLSFWFYIVGEKNVSATKFLNKVDINNSLSIKPLNALDQFDTQKRSRKVQIKNLKGDKFDCYKKGTGPKFA